MSKEHKIQELNALMMQYSMLKNDPANRARCRRLKNEAAVILFSKELRNSLLNRAKNIQGGLYSIYAPQDFLNEAVVKYIDKFDHEQSDNFYGYLWENLEYTVRNMVRAEYKGKKEEDGSITYKLRENTNAGTINEDGEEVPFWEMLSDPASDVETKVTGQMLFGEALSEEQQEIRLRFREYLSKLIPCVIHSQEHRGKRGMYYRSFATDFYISFCKSGLHGMYDCNEAEAFSVMDLGFADFTLTEACRSFSEMEAVPCRTYSELGISGKNFAVGELHTPFKNCVYEKYHKVTDGSVSQQWGYFYKDIRPNTNGKK